MTDYKQLCAELVEELAAETTLYPGYEREIVTRARAALAKPEPEGPTNEELLEAVKAGVASFPPRHPEALNLSAVEYEVELEIRKARAVLAHLGNHPGSPDSSTLQPIPVSEWPEFSNCDDAERVWCWSWAIGTWRLSRINQPIHSHWLPANALPLPSHD